VERGEAGRIAGDEIGNDLMNHRCHGRITVGMSSHTTAVHQVSVLRLDDAIGNATAPAQRVCETRHREEGGAARARKSLIASNSLFPAA
jgi:hypothetical protein